jgi:hypothetical protein
LKLMILLCLQVSIRRGNSTDGIRHEAKSPPLKGN